MNTPPPTNTDAHDVARVHRDEKRLLLTVADAGLGDLFCLRSLLRSIKRAHPGHQLVVGVKEAYHPALQDHPDVDRLVNWRNHEPYTYTVAYDLRPSMSVACSKGWNVTDTWTSQMGLQVDDRLMRFRLTKEERDWAVDLLGAKPTVALCPIASTRVRDLSIPCQQETTQALLDNGWNVVAIHKERLPHLPPEVIQVPNMTLRQMIALHHAVDACITTDTCHSHLSGGIGKPGVHCYSQQCGHIYTRHYPGAKVLQYHPPGTKSQLKDMSNFTAQDIIKAFEEATR